MIGGFEKKLINILNYKPPFPVICQTWVHKFMFDVKASILWHECIVKLAQEEKQKRMGLFMFDGSKIYKLVPIYIRWP